MMGEALRVVTVLGGVENHYFSESIQNLVSLGRG